MPGLSLGSPLNQRSGGSRSAAFPSLFLVLLLAIPTFSWGCRPDSQGSLDIEALRQKSIAAGKPDPIPDSPTTPEARKARAEMLLKEAKEKTSKGP